LNGKLAAQEENEDEDTADLGEIEDIDIPSLFNGTNFNICVID